MNMNDNERALLAENERLREELASAERSLRTNRIVLRHLRNGDSYKDSVFAALNEGEDRPSVYPPDGAVYPAWQAPRSDGGQDD